MTVIRRAVNVNSDVVRKICIGLIVSDEYCREVVPVIKPDFFEASYAKTIYRWIFIYWKKYSRAPKKDIQDIFLVESEKMDADERDAVSGFLSSISNQFEADGDFNHQYLRDQTLTFLRQRSIEITTRKAKALLEMGKMDDAEAAMREFQNVSKATSQWQNPFAPEIMERIIEEEDKEFFILPGKVGELLGNFRREDLVGVLAPFKRGKSWWLMDMAVWGVMKKLSVAYINLEMAENRTLMRFYKRVTAFGDRGGDFIYPTFDCRKNQLGTCFRAERTNRVALAEAGMEKPLFTPELEYRPCVYCRERNLQEYDPESWFTIIQRKKLTYASLTKTVSGLQHMVGDRLRVRTYPAYEANLAMIKNDLDALEYTEGFVPDVVVIDYADILAPENERVEGREQIDRTWKGLKNLAAKRHILLFTATQANRVSADKKSIKATDVSEDIRKMAHVDAMIMLNQTPKEKTNGVMRVSILKRHEAFFENTQVRVLQNFTLGQPILDSEMEKRRTGG